MLESLENARKKFFDFLLPEGMDPLYIATILLIIYVLVEWKNFRRWEKLSKNQKSLLKALLFVTSISVIGSIIKLIGVV